MENELREEYSIPNDWDVSSGETREKERINQSTETTEFIATSSDGKQKRTFTYTIFSNYKGQKKSWRETTE